MKCKLFLLLIVLVALGAMSSSPTAGATTLPANGRIAYRAGSEIRVMNSDGSGVTRLTYSPQESEGDLAWSPDGRRLAYYRGRADANGNMSYSSICIINAYGNDLQVLVDEGAFDEVGGPAWSPDGTKIAFSGTLDGDSDIYVINVDGTGLVNLTSDNGGRNALDSGPTWSPDGTKIAFASDRDSSPEFLVNDIYVMNAANGGNVLNLTQTGDAAHEFQAKWSPDGTKIAFVREWDPNFAGDIFVMNADGDNQTRLTVTSVSVEDYLGGWSPDGTKIIFSSERAGTHDIFVMNADGSEQTRLTFKPTLEMQPTWQPLPAGTFVKEPANDAYVVSSSKNKTYNRPFLQVVNAQADRIAYLKFSVQDIAAPVASASLHLYVTNDSPDGGSVYVTPPIYAGSTTQWLETGLTWNNAPAIVGAPLVQWGRVRVGRWVDVDVTAAVAAAQVGDGRASFAILNNSANMAAYSSQEGARAPELVVVTTE